jgi:hypothetical protein
MNQIVRPSSFVPAGFIVELLAEAARHGVTMEVEGGRLSLDAASEPPADLLARIRANTAAIIRHLDAKLLPHSDRDPAELFADNVRKSILCHSEILDHPFDPEDFRMARVKSDTATAVLNVAARGSPDQLRIKRYGSGPLSPGLLAAGSARTIAPAPAGMPRQRPARLVGRPRRVGRLGGRDPAVSEAAGKAPGRLGQARKRAAGKQDNQAPVLRALPSERENGDFEASAGGRNRA